MTSRTRTPDGGRLISQAETATRLGRSTEWVRRQRDPSYPHRDPTFPTPCRIGRSVLFGTDELDTWLEGTRMARPEVSA